MNDSVTDLSASIHPTSLEETLIDDDREAARPAERVEQRLMRQCEESSVGVSVCRIRQCDRGLPRA